jgi:signal transduction histidine kinase
MAIDSMRHIVATLRPLVLDRLGLGAALRQEVRAFAARTCADGLPRTS